LTYWATLWYAGAVVLQLGYEGQTQYECEVLAEAMRIDIERSYADPAKIDDLALSLFPTNEFSVTCEEQMLEIDERYAE
jgi:hypothetical protein